jgi:hypothetical protein
MEAVMQLEPDLVKWFESVCNTSFDIIKNHKKIVDSIAQSVSHDRNDVIFALIAIVITFVVAVKMINIVHEYTEGVAISLEMMVAVIVLYTYLLSTLEDAL